MIAAVNFGRDRGLEVAVMGGGHSGPGLGLADDGLTIDLSPMRWVRVDPEARTAQVGGGSQIGDLDHAAHAFGLGVPAGIYSQTGVGGLTLGGGHGYLTRKYGLTIDSLLAVDVVLTDGSFVKASERENQDCLGGPGLGGTLDRTSFTPAAPATPWGGDQRLPIEQTPAVLAGTRFSPGLGDL